MQTGTIQTASDPAGAGEFHPVIVRRNGRYCVYLAEWKIGGEGSTVEEAYQEFERNRLAMETRAATFGLATLTPEAYPLLKRRGIYEELGLFFVKAATCACAVILVMVLLLPNIGAAVGNRVKQLLPAFPENLRHMKYWAIQLPSQANARLDRLTPEEEDQMRKEWNRLLVRTAPIWKVISEAAAKDPEKAPAKDPEKAPAKDPEKPLRK